MTPAMSVAGILQAVMIASVLYIVNLLQGKGLKSKAKSIAQKKKLTEAQQSRRKQKDAAAEEIETGRCSEYERDYVSVSRKRMDYTSATICIGVALKLQMP